MFTILAPAEDLVLQRESRVVRTRLHNGEFSDEEMRLDSCVEERVDEE